MKAIFKLTSLLIFLFLFKPITLNSQITVSSSIKTDQFSSTVDTSIIIPVYKMPSVNNKTLNELYKNEDIEGKPFKFAYVFEVSINIKENGILFEIPNVGKIWKLCIKSPSAYSLNFAITNYNLPKGAELYIYNKDKTSVLGALTRINNDSSRILPTIPIEGDEVYFEYFEPLGVEFSASPIISRVAHDYKGIFGKKSDEDGYFGTSGACNVDINCPEGINWQNEKRSVCRLLINGSSLCSGALINNAANNGTPYVLTANHCISTNGSANNTVFVFNYESPTCGGSDGSISQSISGATLRANWQTSDFSLVQINTPVPFSYHPYYSGWYNVNSRPTAPVVAIHHPAADVKKISRDNASPTSSISDTHWFVDSWVVGTTQAGSSGSPLYNSTHRIVGQDHQGDGYGPCDPNKGSHYGKLSSSWAGGGTNATRLMSWLDPSNTIIEIPGLRFISDAVIVSNTGVSGDIVKMNNVSIQSGSNITSDINNWLEVSGTFEAPLGAILLFTP